MAILRVPIEQQWTGAGSPGVNVWHIRADDTLVQETLDLMLAALHDFYASISSYFGPGWVASFEAAVDEESREAYSSTAFPTMSNTGGNAAPPALAICIGWKTNTVARRGMGRTFLGPLNGTVIELDGTISAGVVTGISTAAQALVDVSETANNGALGVYGYQNAVPKGGSRQPTDPRVIRDITGFRIRDQFAIMRSRRD